MKKLVVCICGAVFPAAALAETPQNQWLQRVADRGAQIEVIRVASEKPVIAVEETDVEIESILDEVEALEKETSDYPEED